jgi:hypothetical protein
LTKTRASGRLVALAGLVPLFLAAPAAAELHGQGGTSLLAQIRDHRTQTWSWQRVMGRPPTPDRFRERTASPVRQVTIRDVWKRRANVARRMARRPPHYAAWLCIHRHEGSWQDAGAPYYGGLQMDLSFQEAYGAPLLRRKGTAENWTPLEQMWVAEKALRAGRGFHPWLNAAASCGLL